MANRGREKFCPKCGADITDSYEPEDSSVGITGGWYCEACDEGYVDEYQDESDYDL